MADKTGGVVARTTVALDEEPGDKDDCDRSGSAGVVVPVAVYVAVDPSTATADGWRLAVSSSCFRVASRRDLDSVAQLGRALPIVAVAEASEASVCSMVVARAEVGAGTEVAIMGCLALDVQELRLREPNFEMSGVFDDLFDAQLNSPRSNPPTLEILEASLAQVLSHLYCLLNQRRPCSDGRHLRVTRSVVSRLVCLREEHACPQRRVFESDTTLGKRTNDFSGFRHPGVPRSPIELL